MTRPKQPETFRYAVIGVAIIVVAAGILGVMQHVQIRRDVNTVNERNNVLLARVFANLVWPNIRDLVAAAHRLPPDTLKTHAIIRETHEHAQAMTKDVPLLKINIFDLDGLTVFSTDPSQIGEKKGDYAGFLSARKGKVLSILNQREKFTGLQGPVYNRRVLSSYVPVEGPGGEIEGVFEIYSDVTEPMTQARNSAMLQLALVGLVFLVMFEIGVFLIRQRDRTIADIHAEHLRLTEATVAAEQASRAKSALLANMSHELRTPLNAIIGFAETMRMQPFGPIGSGKYLAYLEDIGASGQRLVGIIDNVLEMARIDSGAAKLQLSGVSVSEIIERSVYEAKSATPRPRAALRIHAPRSPITVLVDKSRIVLVLVRLLENAYRFTPTHGSIEISAKRNGDGDLEITVTDTGIGMTQDDLDAALIPFAKMDTPYQHKSDGARFGLPLARMLMEMHGGTIRIESVLGKGTSVTAVLPSQSIVAGSDREAISSFNI